MMISHSIKTVFLLFVLFFQANAYAEKTAKTTNTSSKKKQKNVSDKKHKQKQNNPRKFEGLFCEYREHPLDLVELFIPQNPIIFEAGGHYGEDTVKFAKKWPNSHIISFEPNPNAFKNLMETTNGFKNVKAYNLAVNDYTGTAILNICYGTTGDNQKFEGSSSLLQASPAMEIHYQGPKAEVSCVVLDDWCKKNNIDHIDFMWLDIEGLELRVLKASPSILATVKAIYTETNFFDFRIGMAQYEELRSFLESSGFKLLSHWYREGLQGNAIFITKELFDALPKK